MSFGGELKRRNVYKVGIAYAIVAWLIAQIASTIFQAYQMPTWTMTFVTTILIIGFPLALLFAWAFEITPDGIKLTKDVPRAESITRLTGQKLNYTYAKWVHALWFQIMQEVRQLPRFKEFIREIDLVIYWNEFGWPDICRPLDNGDFECD